MTKSKKSKKQNDVQEEDWSLDDSQLYELLKSMYWENGIAQNKNRFKNEFMGKNQIKDKEFYRRWFNENAMSWDDWWDFFFPFFLIKALAYKEKRISNFTEYCPDEFKRFKVYMSPDEHVAWTILWVRLKFRLGDVCKNIHDGCVFRGIHFGDDLKNLVA